MLVSPSLCDHCGNETYKAIEGDFLSSGNDAEGYIMYSLQMCQICNMPLLLEYVFKDLMDYRIYKESGYLHHDGSSQIYPYPLYLSPEAPERVRQIYEEARLVMVKSPSSYVVQIGRALEAITKDKKANGRTLYHQLEWLVENDFLPAQLGVMAQLNRVIRNLGAHDFAQDIQVDDVVIVDEFFKTIVEYLYVAPSKIDLVQELIEQKRASRVGKQE